MEKKKLLKYRVNLADGSSMIIEASNSHNAISLARSMIGQLPNDINKKVVANMIELIDNEIQKLHSLKQNILTSAKELDWTSVYDNMKNYIDSLKDSEYNDKLKEINGSLVKVNKEENKIGR